MSTPQVFQFRAMEDGSGYAMARVYKKDSSHNLVVVSSSDFTSITRSVFHEGATVIGPTTLTVGDTILSSLSTGTIWTVDTTGFNFIDSVPATAFPDGDKTYRLEYKLTFTSGIVAWIPFDATTIPVATS